MLDRFPAELLADGSGERFAVFDTVIEMPPLCRRDDTFVQSLLCKKGDELRSGYTHVIKSGATGADQAYREQYFYRTDFRDDARSQLQKITVSLCRVVDCGDLRHVNNLARAEWQRSQYRNQSLKVNDAAYLCRGIEGVNWRLYQSPHHEWLSVGRYVKNTHTAQFYLTPIHEHYYLAVSVERYGLIKPDAEPAFSETFCDSYVDGLKLFDLKGDIQSSCFSTTRLDDMSFMSEKDKAIAEKVVRQQPASRPFTTQYQEEEVSDFATLVLFGLALMSVVALIYYAAHWHDHSLVPLVVAYFGFQVPYKLTDNTRIRRLNLRMRLPYKPLAWLHAYAMASGFFTMVIGLGYLIWQYFFL